LTSFLCFPPLNPRPLPKSSNGMSRRIFCVDISLLPFPPSSTEPPGEDPLCAAAISRELSAFGMIERALLLHFYLPEKGPNCSPARRLQWATGGFFLSGLLLRQSEDGRLYFRPFAQPSSGRQLSLDLVARALSRVRYPSRKGPIHDGCFFL